MTRRSRANPGLSVADSSIARGLLRIRDMPGVLERTVMASPPTFTAGTANGATGISVGRSVYPTDKGAISYFGGYPATSASINNAMGIGRDPAYPLLSSTPPWAAEFYSDSANVEIGCVGDANLATTYRLIVDGQMTTAGTAGVVGGHADTSYYSDLFAFGSTKTRHFRLEMDPGFRLSGIRIDATASMVRTPDEDFTIVMGDSFTEPTIRDTGVTYPNRHDGWGGVFGRALGLRNIMMSGSGGTGYLNPNTAASRYTARQRFAGDVVPYNPARVFFAFGINDGDREPTYTPQMEYDECLLLFAQAKAALPYTEFFVYSPWAAKGGASFSLLGFGDAIAAAAAASGFRFGDLLRMVPPRLRVNGLLAAAITSTSATSILTSVPFPIGADINIGVTSRSATPAQLGYGTVTGCTGTGPYTVSLANPVGATWANNSPVFTTGKCWTFGGGRQGATNGAGPSDVLISDDSTHPTVLGHKVAGRAAFQAYASQLAY